MRTGTAAAASVEPGTGAWTVFFTLPHAASTAATGAGNAGNRLADGSASTTVQADSERIRPFTHQLSASSTPGSRSAHRAAIVSVEPNPSAMKWRATAWNGKDRGTPAAIASSVS